MSSSFEEALSNIDIFCSVLVKKIIEDEEPKVKPEPIENLLRKKHGIEIYRDFRRGEEPLIDIFEDEGQVKVLMQCSHVKHEVRLDPCGGYMEIWEGGGRKAKIPIKSSDANKTAIRWNNNVLEIIIEK